MGIYYPYTLLEESFEEYVKGQPYGEWTVDEGSYNEELGGSGTKFIYTNVKSGKTVRYVFASAIRRWYLNLKARYSYGSHQLGTFFGLDIHLKYLGGELIARLVFDVAKDEIRLDIINPNTKETLYSYVYLFKVSDLEDGSKRKLIDTYYVDVIIYIDKDTDHLMIELGDEKNKLCQVSQDTNIIIGDLYEIDLIPSTNAAYADVDICVDDIHIESDEPMSVQVQQTVTSAAMDLASVMMYVVIVLIIVSMIMHFINSLTNMFVGVYR